MELTLEQEIKLKTEHINSLTKQLHLSDSIRNKAMIKATYALLEILKEEKQNIKKWS